MLQGKLVSLRVVTRADLALLESWNNNTNFHSTYNNFGLHPADQSAKRFEEDGLLGSRIGELLIMLPNETVIGLVSYNRIGHGPGESNLAFNIGVVVAPAYRGKGYGVEAQKLLADYLFAAYPIMRIEALTDVENSAEQRALAKAGFTREGILRQAQWRTGGWHDLVMYSKLRGE